MKTRPTPSFSPDYTPWLVDVHALFPSQLRATDETRETTLEKLCGATGDTLLSVGDPVEGASVHSTPTEYGPGGTWAPGPHIFSFLEKG